jgi:hypothetical protein
MTTDSQQPQTALEMWAVQAQALANPMLADAAINAIYESLIPLHARLMDSGNVKAADRVESAYNQALSIHTMTTQQAAVIAGADAAIGAAVSQRDQAVTELQMLLTSIQKGDEAHPILSDYASSIRADEREDTLNDPYVFESVYEGAAEQADEALYDMIMETWDVPYVSGDAVIALLVGNSDPTDEQRALILKLFATTQPQIIKRDPLTPVLRDLGGHSAKDDDELDTDGDE